MLSCPIVSAARRLPSASRFPRPSRRPIELDRAQQRITAPEREPRLVEPSAFDTLHGKRNRAARADRVDAQLVAQLRCAEHGIRVAHATERTQCKQTLVFQADALLVADRVDVLAPDGARDAARARSAVAGAELLGRNVGGALERAALEVAGRQRAEAIERQQIGRGAKLAVLGGRRTERPSSTGSCCTQSARAGAPTRSAVCRARRSP